jgi:DNA-binding Lrp family transcriptional regulator
MTKEEARERLRRLIDEGLIKTIGHAERREKALDAYAQACVDAALEIERNTIIVQEANHDEGQYEEDADTLGMLEVIAKRSRLLALGQLPPEPVYVSYEGDTFVYYRSPTGEHVTRDEARALLAGKGEKE